MIAIKEGSLFELERRTELRKPRIKKPTLRSVFLFGAGNEIRTRDPNLGKVVLYQLSYSRVKFLTCAWGRRATLIDFSKVKLLSTELFPQ